MDEDNQHRKMIPAASEVPSTEFSSASKLAIYHAKLILGSYRADQAADPEIYVTAISHLLSRYPDWIGAQLTDPKDGIAGKCKWLPAVSEVREEADRLATDYRKEQERETELRAQWKMRDDMEKLDAEETVEYRRKVVERYFRERDAAAEAKKRAKEQTWKQFSTEQLLAKYPRP